MAAPFVLGAALAGRLYPRQGEGAPRLPFVFFVGAAMGITAFPVLARILADRRMMHTRAGMFAISCAAFDDLAAWCLLAVITVIGRPDAVHSPLPWHFAGLAGYILETLGLIRPALRLGLLANAVAGLGRFGLVLTLLLLSVWATERWPFMLCSALL